MRQADGAHAGPGSIAIENSGIETVRVEFLIAKCRGDADIQ